MQANTGYLGDNPSVAEITVKAVILAIILTAILCASNIYLALKLGQTIAASIPAAVISMGILRFFRKNNILENNIVQTAASAGEGLASGISFVLPALVMTGYWNYFHYWETVLLSAIGGLFGVLFSIPLRRIMLNYPTLSFPEGKAIGNVLKSKEAGTAQMSKLLQGGVVGGIITLCQTGFKTLSDSVQLWTMAGKSLIGMGIGLSPALIGAGFIIGMQACVALLVGVVLAWLIGAPILGHFYGLPQASNLYDMAMALRAQHIRFIGVGTMLLAGVWTLFKLMKPITSSIAASINSLGQARRNAHLPENVLPRTERDIPFHFVLIGIVGLAILTFFVLAYLLKLEQFSITMHYVLSGFAVLFILVIGFFIAAVCAYLSGLVGMTNNPLSGLMISCVLLSSLILLVVMGSMLHTPEAIKAAVAVVLIITTIIAASTAISGENIQDLKAGQMVGATPWKQQVMILMGVIVASCVIGPVLELLFQAYGIGGAFPRAGMNPSQALGAPQAALMAAIAGGAFGHSLPVMDISIGMGIALIAIFVDEYLKKSGKRLPILAIGIGIYLPPDIPTAVVIGGILNYICKNVIVGRLRDKNDPEAIDKAFGNGILVACGLVAGAALMGVILAIPFVIQGSSDALTLVKESFAPVATVLGVIVTVGLCYWLYKMTCSKVQA
jgi:putative OPT family oligopeptide transporter